ncbi:trypsin-like serine protease [Lentzea sp. NPDC051838]|uniref:trypsin-like serine protease n=1 Tax=Lentzea sp. NPDC051838 TaxID=3154849 RepID=UPI00343D08E2
MKLLSRALVAMGAVAAATVVVPASGVVDGTPVADGAQPYVARITVGTESACTGALIDPYWVVTANGCVPDGREATAVIGRTQAGQTTGVTSKITQVVRRDDRDIALVKLEFPVMDLPKLKIATTPAAAGEVLKISGWGRTRQTFANDRLHVASFSVDSANGQTVAVTGQSVGLCKGDAGGPAIREVNGVAELVAVGTKSWQGGCYGVSDTRTGATAGRVDNIGAWITEQIGGRTVTLKNNYTQKCAVQFGFEPTAGTTLKQYTCAPYLDQVWTLKPVNGGFAVYNVHTKLCASARGTSDVAGWTVPMLDCSAAEPLQAWQVNAVANGTQIRNSVTGLCLAVWWRTPDDGAEATYQVCEAAYADQVWTLNS